MYHEKILKYFTLDLNDISKNEKKIYENEIKKNISIISTENLDYEFFFWNYMKRNLPIIIDSISNDWECSKNWITKDYKINFKYLKEKIPNFIVPIYNCLKQEFNSNEKFEMKFWDFLNYWEKRIETNNMNEEINPGLYYLKDWHLKKMIPDYDFYTTPMYFASDWLNEYLIDNNQDDYMFVYMGPKDSYTPFHSDVTCSYSWSTNIYGRKKWIFLPPAEESKLKDNLGNLPYTIDEDLLKKCDCKYFILIQERNQTIFVPSGWYHQVYNLDDTISINHNWFNGCNIKMVWNFLKNSFLDVEKEIENLKEIDSFFEQCQIILKSLVGFSFKDLYNILKYILRKRLQGIEEKKEIILFNKYILGTNHILYDIEVLNQMIEEISQLISESDLKV